MRKVFTAVILSGALSFVPALAQEKKDMPMKGQMPTKEGMPMKGEGMHGGMDMSIRRCQKLFRVGHECWACRRGAPGSSR